MAKAKNSDVPIIESDWIHIFTCGVIPQLRWIEGEPVVVDVEVTREHILEIVASYESGFVDEAPFIIGHANWDQPALAWVSKLKVDGEELWCKLKNPTPRMLEIIANGEYQYTSIGVEGMMIAGKLVRYLEHLAATNFPLKKGLSKFPEKFTSIAASKKTELDSMYQYTTDLKSFSKGLQASMPKNLNNNTMNEFVKLFCARIGLNVNAYPTDESALQAAYAIIKDLMGKFPEGTEQPTSLEMCVISCGKLVTKVTELNASLTASQTDLKTLQSERIDFVINAAKESGKIVPAQEADLRASLISNFDNTSKLIASMKPNGILAANQIHNGGLGETKVEAAANETFDSLSKNDPEKLKSIKATNIEQFKKLYKDEFKEDYVP